MKPDRSRSRESLASRGSKNSKFSKQSLLSRASVSSKPLLFEGTGKIKTGAPIQEGFKVPVRRKQHDYDEYTALEWTEAGQRAQKFWYDNEEGEICDQTTNKQKLHQTQATKRLLQALEGRAEGKGPRMSFQQKQRIAQHSKWQLNRLLNSGFFKVRDPSQMDEQDEVRVLLQVHDLRPPFLDEKVRYKSSAQQVQTVKNPASDIALMAKRGSQVLKAFREHSERTKAADRFWDLKGSKLGKLLKLEGEKITTEPVDDGQEARFSTLLARRNVAVSEFARTKTLLQQKQSLPIFSVKEELMKLIRENRVVVIVGETGSGKTTQLTQYLLEEGYCQKFGLIGCTQPRRVAAVSVAKRVAQQRNCDLGQEVGYAIRFQDCTSPSTKIKYMTDGVLLRESLNDPDLQRYGAVIMDEAHERSLNTDVLFGILKKVAQRRRDLRLIVTSATLNAEKFSSFFEGAPVFLIPGRTFPVELIYEKAPVDDYVDSAVKKTIQVHLQQPPGDILVFMTGQQDINATCTLLSQRLEKLEKSPPLVILPIYSQLRSEQQARIFDQCEHRKCIVATNIAETSLTLDGVRYVIDTGLCKLKVYNPRIGMDALQVTPVSQANASQRSGRAGRTGPGTCYRLYTGTMFRQDLFQNNIPEIQRTNLTNVVLLLKSLHIANLMEFQFMDPPPQQTILSSMYQLWVLSALDNLGQLTVVGQRMAEFPVDPPLSRMILMANQLGCIEEVLTVVSMLSVPSIFFKPKDREQEAESARQKLVVPESDHLTYLNIYEQWKKHDYSSEWAAQHFLQAKSLRKVREVRGQLRDIAKELKLRLVSCGSNFDLVRKAICSGYFTNAAKFKGIGDYVNLRTGMPCKLHPSSALFSLGFIPEYIVYHELVMTTKQFMSCVTSVDPYWLAELGPMFYSVKSAAAQKKTGLSLLETGLQQARAAQERARQAKLQEEETERVRRRQLASIAVGVGEKWQKQGQNKRHI